MQGDLVAGERDDLSLFHKIFRILMQLRSWKCKETSGGRKRGNGDTGQKQNRYSWDWGNKLGRQDVKVFVLIHFEVKLPRFSKEVKS